jgi:hypothetical protein
MCIQHTNKAHLRPLGALVRPLDLLLLQINLGSILLIVVFGIRNFSIAVTVSCASCEGGQYMTSEVGQERRTEAEEVGHGLREDITCDFRSDLHEVSQSSRTTETGRDSRP